MAVVLNVEADHLDFFKDLDDIKASFRRFAELVPPGGHVIVNADNAGALDVARGLDAFTFGLGCPWRGRRTSSPAFRPSTWTDRPLLPPPAGSTRAWPFSSWRA